VQGDDLLIEYDKHSSDGNHAHTVLRRPRSDFGDDVLAAHYRKLRHQTRRRAARRPGARLAAVTHFSRVNMIVIDVPDADHDQEAGVLGHGHRARSWTASGSSPSTTAGGWGPARASICMLVQRIGGGPARFTSIFTLATSKPRWPAWKQAGAPASRRPTAGGSCATQPAWCSAWSPTRREPLPRTMPSAGTDSGTTRRDSVGLACADGTALPSGTPGTGSGRGGTGDDTTIELTVFPYSRNLSRISCQLVHRRACILIQEAILAGDPVALGDLRKLSRQLRDPGQLPGGRPDPGERRHRQDPAPPGSPPSGSR
jgi:hypothetical protein